MKLGYHSLNLAEVEAANKAWGFNCGPGALCGITGLKPEELRRFLGDFEQKGYTNPTLMRDALTRMKLRFAWRTVRPESAEQNPRDQLPTFGLARVQWGGPWCGGGVPRAARYRQTHWIATARHPKRGIGILDVNNNTGDNKIGWTPFADWERVVVPALIATYPRADGTWWLTHSVEVLRA